MRLSDVEVYEKYASELVRFATGLVGPDDAADVVADAFVKVLGSVSWETVDDQRAYLYRSVVNVVRMRYRSTMRRRAREMRTAESEAVFDPEVRPGGDGSDGSPDGEAEVGCRPYVLGGLVSVGGGATFGCFGWDGAPPFGPGPVEVEGGFECLIV